MIKTNCGIVGNIPNNHQLIEKLIEQEETQEKKKKKTKQIRGRGSVLDMEIQGLFHTNILLQGLK